MRYGSCVFSWNCASTIMINYVRGWKTAPDITTVPAVAPVRDNWVHIKASFNHLAGFRFLKLGDEDCEGIASVGIKG